MLAKCACGHPIDVKVYQTYRGVEIWCRSARGMQQPFTDECPNCGSTLPEALRAIPRETCESLMVAVGENLAGDHGERFGALAKCGT